MRTPGSPTYPPTSSSDLLVAACVLGVLVFVGNYLCVSDFGIYEDDYIFTTPGFLWAWPDAWERIKHACLYWPQGRPVGFALAHLLTFVSGRFSSLMPGFAAGFAIQWVNAVLFFALASRFVRSPVALVAAAVFALYPVDNAKQMLQLRVFNELNLTFLLAAFHLYVRDRLLLAYATATLCFLTYESVFFPFVIAPLLAPSLRDIRPRRVLVHAAACLAIPAACILLRKRLGDPRVGDVLGDFGQILTKVLAACAIGPWTSLSSLAQRAWDGLWRASGTPALAAVLVAASMALVLARQLATDPLEGNGRETAPAAPLALAGGLGLVAGYVLAFRADNYPPVVTVGRLSGFNGAGATGACLLMAAVFGLARERLGPRGRWTWATGAALLVAGLVSFGIEVQRRDYVESWRQQREIWSAVLATSGEWEASTPIVVDLDSGDPGAGSTRGFDHNWMTVYGPIAIRQLVELPRAWEQHPVCCGSWTPALFGFSRSGAEAVAGGVRLRVHPWLGGPESWPVLRDGQFILFQYAGTRLVRVSEPFDTGGGIVRPKQQPSQPPAMLPPTRLYRALTGIPPEWPSLASAKAYPQ